MKTQIIEVRQVPRLINYRRNRDKKSFKKSVLLYVTIKLI